MVRPVRPAHAGSPHGGAEDDHGQEEENAGYFKPEDSSDAAEGAQKAAQSSRNTARGLAGNLAGGAGLSSGGSGLLRGRLVGGALGAGRHALAGHASGNAESDTKSAADGLRLHFVLMVTAQLAMGLATDDRRRRVALKRRWK